MRLNTGAYWDILSKKSLDGARVCKGTALTEKTLFGLLEGNSVEISTLEQIADALGCDVAEITLPDYEGYSENVIEWLKDQEQATVTLTQRRMISRVKKLAQNRPKECQVLGENPDGSISAHVPVSWIKINPTRELSEKQRAERAEAIRRNVFNKSNYFGN